MLTNVEVEGVRARAIIVVCIVECVSTTLGIVDFVPSELLTGILMEGVMRSVVNCQVEGVNVSASGTLLCVVKCICPGCSIGCAVPCVFIAGGYVVGGVVVPGNGEV
jgi:hypothetical protein